MRHVIFDLDGTLLDSLPGIEWSVREACTACGLQPPAGSLAPLLGPPIRSILAEVAGDSEALDLDRLEQTFRRHYDSEGWRLTALFPGAADLLQRLCERGFGLWVATNKPRLSTGKILKELGLDEVFREVACRDSRTPAFSGKAELLRDLVARHQLMPEECLMVGDTREDAGAAAAAGIRCVLVGRVPDFSAVERSLVN